MPRWQRTLGCVVGSSLVLAGHASTAYDLRTHGVVTVRAFDNSEGVKAYLQSLGIRSTDTFTVEPPSDPTELADFKNTGTPQGWMIEGAIREDDYSPHPGLEAGGCPPPLNPPSSIDRSVNHFFDVQRDGRGLTVLGQTLGFPAPDWALGRQGRDQNRFSLLDARNYQAQSITASTRGDRDRNTALFFRALGQVLHLLEDSAAPQHTRNEPHIGCLGAVGGEHSWYETYIETRATGRTFRSRSQVSRPLVLDGYAPVSLRNYQDFFAEPDPGRRGIAHFSSRNFFSAGTNLAVVFSNCGGLLEPVCEPAAYGRKRQGFSIQSVDGTTRSGTVTLYTRDAVDPLTGETIAGVPVSARSVWDQHLETRGILPVFTLNTINYDAAADILLPRAVGYAAGLLDYFFRARMEVQSQLAFGPSGSAPGIRIVNRTPGEAMDGTFELLYDKTGGTRVSLATWQLTLPPDDPNASGVLVIPPAQEAEEFGRYLLVFHGTLRGEFTSEPEAVAATWFGLALSFSMQRIIGNGAVLLDTSFAAPAPVPVDYPVVLAASASHEKDPYGPRFPGEGERFVKLGFYRSPIAVSGNTAVVTFSSFFCLQRILVSLDPVDYTNNVTPATAQLVEFTAPGSIEEFYQYRWPGPPVARVLAEFSGEGGGFAVDITDARFLGVVLTADIPSGGGFGYQNSCGGGVEIQFVD